METEKKEVAAERFDKLAEFIEGGPWVDLHEYPTDDPEFKARIDKLYELVAELKGETESEKIKKTLFECNEQRLRLFYAMLKLAEDARAGREIRGRLIGTIDDIQNEYSSYNFELFINGLEPKPWTPEEAAPPWE
jgi:hypothetical protein